VKKLPVFAKCLVKLSQLPICNSSILVITVCLYSKDPVARRNVFRLENESVLYSARDALMVICGAICRMNLKQLQEGS